MKIFILLIAVVALLVFFNAISRDYFLENSLFTIASPFSRLGIAVSDFLSYSFRTLTTIKNLISENSDLRNENKNLVGELAQYRNLAKENELLRSQLGVSAKQKYTLLSGEIVSFDPVNFTNYLLIDKGSSAGLSEGMPVIMPGNIVLGKISETRLAYSVVTLISDKNNKVNVAADREGGASGVLSGSSGGAILMDLIEKNAVLEEGDLILTSGLDGVYPKDLIVGKVTKVVASEGGIFKQAYIKPAYAEFQNNLIFVVSNYLK